MRYGGFFRLAHELKKHLHELLGFPAPMTFRQYLAWTAWLDREWNSPSRSDHYAMQTAFLIDNIADAFRSSPSSRSMADYRVKFKSEEERLAESTTMSRERLIERKKAAVVGMVEALGGRPVLGYEGYGSTVDAGAAAASGVSYREPVKLSIKDLAHMSDAELEAYVAEEERQNA